MKLSIFIFFITQFSNCNKYSRFGNCVSGNCSNGIGFYEFLNTTRKGLFRDGKFLKGEHITHENCKHKGEFESYSNYESYSNGYLKSDCNDIIQDGFWELGSMQGQGTIIHKDKKKFSGLWNNDNLCFIGNCENGFGILIFRNGYFISEFKDKKVSGLGVVESNYGNSFYEVYIGEILKSKANGNGIMINKNGEQRGNFIDDIYQESK